MTAHTPAPTRARSRNTGEPARSAQQAPTSSRARWWIEGLDGWRALAIVAVLIFHLRPETLPGGFIGVDVFFVISGFLITTLLVRELNKNGKVDLPRFWVRRARRLLPALFTVVTISTVAAFFAGGDLLVGIGRHILGALTFSNNWVEISVGADYFEAATPNLFMNFWSLAVEEQFYLLWPLLAILIMAFLPRGRSRVRLLAGAALISAIAMAAWYTPEATTRVYYGTDTHAFGLLAGAALAFAMAAPDLTFFDTPRWQRLRVPLALGGLAVVVTLMLTTGGESAFTYRGGLVLASLATACMVAALPGEENRLTAVLTARPVEWVGQRSYGIYLWHWPAILIVDAAWPAAAPDSVSWWVSRAVALGVTLALAAWSFTHIENPIRRDGFKAAARRVRTWWGSIAPRGRGVVALAAGTFTVLLLTAVISAPTHSTLEASMREAQRFVDDATPSATAEPAVEGFEYVEIGQPMTIPGEAVYGVGDSMMYVAAPGLAKKIPGMTINAESNRQWPAVLAELRRVVEEGEVGPVAVIAAGTNAGAQGVSDVEEALEILGPERRVVLVNIYSESSFVEETNKNYEQVAREHPNVAIADWHTAAKEHPEELQPDKVHPNMTGMHLWAGTVIDGLEELQVRIEAPSEG